MASGITPPAPEIGWPPPSNISEKLTARRAPFGHRPLAAPPEGWTAGVVAPALHGRPTALEASASAADAPTAWTASRRLKREGLLAGLVIPSLLMSPHPAASDRVGLEDFGSREGDEASGAAAPPPARSPGRLPVTRARDPPSGRQARRVRRGSAPATRRSPPSQPMSSPWFS